MRGHNYIFEVKETPLSPGGRFSSWSKPYTVNLASLDSLFVQPQPGGSIFISWKEDTFIDNLPVEYFDMSRICGDDTLNLILQANMTSYMDTVNLLHGNKYEYIVSAIDSLGQILAANSREAMSDTGLVFIPDSVQISYRYFNSDSIDVMWQWKDINGAPLVDSTRGAAYMRIQTSIVPSFPLVSGITKTTDWFPANSVNRVKRASIPKTVSSNNDTVFCRITAKDRWDHPDPPIWSQSEIVTYDPYYPNAVNSLTIRSTEAYYACSDTIITQIQWSGRGVEWPLSSDIYWDSRIGNVAYYRVIRGTPDGGSQVIAIVPVFSSVHLIDTTHVYELQDTVRNAEYKWRIVSVDSAGNEMTGSWVEIENVVPTPEPPQPTGFRTCDIQPIQMDGGTNLEYFVEIAQAPEHFLFGYEMAMSEMVDHILCRSGWINEIAFACSSGWGAIVMDTTWFRVKVRQDTIWESGWSQIVSYPGSNDDAQKTGVSGFLEEIPEVFKVQPNFPNPFNAQTVLPYQLPEPGNVEIHIMNIMGALVRTLAQEKKPAGYHSVVWNGLDNLGNSVASGIYFCHVCVELQRGEIFRKWMKMTIIK